MGAKRSSGQARPSGSRPHGRFPQKAGAVRSQRDHRRMHEATWTRSDALAVLEGPVRQRCQNPERLWRRIGLRPGDIVVDVGAGSGFFSFPAASLVGSTGRVYAVDISEELVELVRERAERDKRSNVQSVLSTPQRIPIDDGVADVAILANVLHGISPATVDEAIRVVRPGGRLVDVDWQKRATSEGPPVPHRLSITEAKATLSTRGLTPVDQFELGPAHYVLVFERPRPTRRPRRLVSAE